MRIRGPNRNLPTYSVPVRAFPRAAGNRTPIALQAGTAFSRIVALPLQTWFPRPMLKETMHGDLYQLHFLVERNGMREMVASGAADLPDFLETHAGFWNVAGSFPAEKPFSWGLSAWPIVRGGGRKQIPEWLQIAVLFAGQRLPRCWETDLANGARRFFAESVTRYLDPLSRPPFVTTDLYRLPWNGFWSLRIPRA